MTHRTADNVSHLGGAYRPSGITDRLLGKQV